MSDTLRTRIAAVLKEARIVTYWREGIDEADGQPYRSLVIRSDDQAAEYAADAVIRELGLTRQENELDTSGPYRHRYVTEWTADD